MNTPATHPQTCPAGDRLGRSLLPRPGRDTARGGLSAHASTSGAVLPARQQLPSAFGPGAFQPLSGGPSTYLRGERFKRRMGLPSAAKRCSDGRKVPTAARTSAFGAMPALDLHRGAV